MQCVVSVNYLRDLTTVVEVSLSSGIRSIRLTTFWKSGKSLPVNSPVASARGLVSGRGWLAARHASFRLMGHGMIHGDHHQSIRNHYFVRLSSGIDMNLPNNLKSLYEKLKPLIMDEKPIEPENPTPEETPEPGDHEQETPSDNTEEPKEETLKSHPPVPITAFTVATAIFNGVGVGLLLGMLLGLAVSPVVSGVIGTLSSVLALLLGLNERFLGPLKSIRIGAFGVSCVIAILIGIYIRTHNALSPSLTDLKTEYRSLGYTEQEAKDFVAYQKFGLMPADWTYVESEKEDEEDEPGAEQEDDASGEQDQTLESNEVEDAPEPDQAAIPPLAKEETKPKKGKTLVKQNSQLASVLFSSELDASLCDGMRDVDEGMELKELVNSHTVNGGVWKAIALNFQQALPKEILAKALMAVRDGFCDYGLDEDPIKLAECKDYPASLSVSQIQAKLITEGDAWKLLVDNVKARIPTEHQKALYTSLIKSFCDEEHK